MRTAYLNELSSDIVLKKNTGKIAYRKINEQTVIIHLERNIFNILNATATKLWELIDGQTTLGQILKEMYKDFDIDWQVLNQDCYSFIYEMLEKDLLVSPSEMKKPLGQLKFNKEVEGGLFESLKNQAIFQQIPIAVHLDLTYNCNLNCVHCYITNEHRSTLKLGKIKDILEQLSQAETLYLTISGGEVMVRQDLFKILQYARKLHFALRILTNGTLINEERAEKIASLSPELVAISIYSTNPQIHDQITGVPGSFKKSIFAAELLRKMGIRLKITTVIMKQNINTYQDVYKLSEQLGATFQSDYRIAPKTDGNKFPLNFYINQEQLASVLNDSIFNEEKDLGLEESYEGIYNIIPCGAGHMTCYINPFGDVYPCVQLPINCGNLKEKSFMDIWRKSPQLQEFRSVRISNLTKCSQCKFFNYCRICVGLNYVEEGSMLLPSEKSCEEARIMHGLNRRRR